MSDRIAVMNRGRIEQLGEPEEVYERPTTTFVAGFIGVSNLIPATVRGAGELQLEQGPVVMVPTDGLSTGERCHAVVRPEKLQIEELDGTDASTNGRPRIEGLVESSIYLGTATQMVVAIGEGVRMTVLCPNSDEAERQRLPGGGARVALSWELEHMHVVRGEQQTGEANQEMRSYANQS
jgi:spermidine/putrescine transport system ATP-binding protein